MKNIGVLLIDMQEGFEKDIGDPELIRNQQRLLQEAQKKEIPVFVLEYESYGKTIAELQPFLREKSKIIPKYNDDGFIVVKSPANSSFPEQYVLGRYDSNPNYNVTDSQLKEILDNERIKQLIVTGINKCACYCSTIRGAIKRGYKVHTSPELTNQQEEYFPELDELSFANYETLNELFNEIEKEE
jgi:nicotinamidase-related amidase